MFMCMGMVHMCAYAHVYAYAYVHAYANAYVHVYIMYMYMHMHKEGDTPRARERVSDGERWWGGDDTLVRASAAACKLVENPSHPRRTPAVAVVKLQAASSDLLAHTPPECAHTHARTHARTQARTHARTHARTRAHTHTRKHKHI